MAFISSFARADRQWVGGSGVNGEWWWYGNGETVHGDYNDSNSPEAAAKAAHDSLDNDPNAGLNQFGAPGGSEVADAAAAMDAAQAKVERVFESSPGWTSAVAAFEGGKRAYYKARADVVKALANRTDYVAATRDSAAANEKMDSLRASGRASAADIHAAAAVVLSARTAVMHFEAAACAADPAVWAAQTRTKNAADVMRQLRVQERAAVLANADWQAARQRYENAKTQQVLTAK